MLSDVDSRVINQFGILNRFAAADGAFMAGIPYPGAYVTDEQGMVIAKYFFASHQKRESPELLIDAAIGRISVAPEATTVSAGNDDLRMSAYVHGGNGTLRFGMRRQVDLRLEIAEGLYVGGPRGSAKLIDAQVSVTSASRIVIEQVTYPDTQSIKLQGHSMSVWSGVVAIVAPIFINNEIGDHRNPIDEKSVTVEIDVSLQAISKDTVREPYVQRLKLVVPIDDLDLPNIASLGWHGRTVDFDSTEHMKRLVARKTRQSPLGMLRFLYRFASTKFGALVKPKKGQAK